MPSVSIAIATIVIVFLIFMNILHNLTNICDYSIVKPKFGIF